MGKKSRCSVCGQHRYNMARRIRMYLGEKTFTCKDCGKAFTDKSNCQQHEENHQTEKPYQCSLCGKTFVMAIRLRKHLTTHEDIEAYKCEVCGLGYKRSSYLKKHIQQVHGNEPCQITVNKGDWLG